MNSDDPSDVPQGNDTPRGKYRFQKPKSTALKEIESWAQSKTDRRMDYARQSGQLSDNVTEQRMLQAKIMELSKERYKFMSQNAYERKVFLDRQQQKTKVMRDLLRGIDVKMYVRRAGVLCSDMDPAFTPRKEMKKHGGRLGLLDRLDPTKKHPGPRKVGHEAETHTHVRPHTTMPSISEKGAPGIHGKLAPKTANAALHRRHAGEPPRVNFSSTVDALPDVSSWSRKDSRGTPISVRRDSLVSIDSIEEEEFGSGSPTRVSRLQLMRSSTFSSFRNSRSGDRGTFSRSLSYPNTRNQSRGPTSDPRYYLLTKSLCSNYTPCLAIPAEEVVGVIKKIDTLHMPARRGKEGQSRPKLNQQLQAFMRERGLVLQ